MLEPDSVVGEITDPQGTLKIGNMGDQECVCLSYSGERSFSVVYTAREISSLLAAAKKAAELAPSAKPRSTVRLAALPPKPTRLQIVLVAPENKSPLIILRFIGLGFKQDVFAPPETLVELCQKAERRAPMPGVVGILDRFGAGIWMIEGQTLEVNDDFSHGTGFYGEYIHHSEVPEGQVVRAWTTTMEGKSVVCAFEYAQAWEPTQSPDLPQGQEGDRALSDGQVRQSREVHALLSKTMYETKAVDPTWAAKITLSSIIGDIMMSDDKAGAATWSGQGGNPVLKLGMESLRNGSVSPHDVAIFRMISAYFHTRVTEPTQAIAEINSEMAQTLAYARHNEPQMTHLILNNWALLLRQKGAKWGNPEWKEWEEAKKDYPYQLKPKVFCLPDTFPWIKTWQPAKTGDEPVPSAQPMEEEQIKPGPVELPPVHDKPVEEASAAPRPSPQPAQPEELDLEGDLLEEAGPFKGMKDLNKKKKKSPLPLIVVGLLVVGAPIGYFLANRDSGPKVDPTPTPTVAQTTQVVPKNTPTPEIPKAAPLPPGSLLINGFELTDKLREADILQAGYKVVDEYADGDAGIALYEGPDGSKLMASLTLPARLVTALQGDSLTLDGKVVANQETLPESFEGDKRFSSFKLQAIVNDEGKVLGYDDAVEGIYVAEPLLSAPRGSLALSRKIRNENFFESLPQEFVNMYLTDGNPLLFHFLGANRTGRLKYLLDQGADPNQKSWVDGGTALHHCDNVTTAQLLLKLGADPSITNNEGKTPAETAQLEELRQLLAAPAPTSTPKASVTPSTTTSPSAGSTPEASATP
ncbi:MAG: hypothetical protein KC800_03680 [Candidatus Eremiobacteraeota bacterium]|nr:hypothetical protein [Candidatus Eremiobacteraeota bacterium]